MAALLYSADDVLFCRVICRNLLSFSNPFGYWAVDYRLTERRSLLVYKDTYDEPAMFKNPELQLHSGPQSTYPVSLFFSNMFLGLCGLNRLNRIISHCIIKLKIL